MVEDSKILSMNSMERVEFLLEDMNGKFDFLVEAVSILQKDVAEMKPLVARIPHIEQTLDEAVRTSGLHSRQLTNHEARIMTLEKRVA
jgi:hypothetical protein